MKDKPFDSVKDQIGFCGIWCGSCVAGNGALIELTKRYKEIIEKYSLKDWAPKDFDFKEFMKGLTSIQTISLCPGCLKDGGRPDCEMRSCARSQNIDDCSQCDQSAECENSEELQKMRDGALGAGLFVKMKNVDRQELIEKWTNEIKEKFPHYLSLCGEQ